MSARTYLQLLYEEHSYNWTIHTEALPIYLPVGIGSYESWDSQKPTSCWSGWRVVEWMNENAHNTTATDRNTQEVHSCWKSLLLVHHWNCKYTTRSNETVGWVRQVKHLAIYQLEPFTLLWGKSNFRNVRLHKLATAVKSGGGGVGRPYERVGDIRTSPLSIKDSGVT